MSLYLCDACNEGIPSHKARIHCEVCADYDACASCFVVGNSSKNHNPTHRTTLVKQSGSIQIPPATEAQGRDAYTRPPPPYTFQATPAQIQTNSGSVWSAFFSPMDWKPAEPYIALMNGFWSVLDDRRAGFLTPETLTSFYEAMGIEDNLNICTFYLYPPLRRAFYESRTITVLVSRAALRPDCINLLTINQGNERIKLPMEMAKQGRLIGL